MFNSNTESFPAKQLPHESGLMTTCLAPNGSVKQLEHLAATLPDVCPEESLSTKTQAKRRRTNSDVEAIVVSGGCAGEKQAQCKPGMKSASS